MKKLNLMLLVFLCCLLSVASVLAQNATVKGTVTNKTDGQPVPLVNVVTQVAGETRGAQTDYDGNYSLDLPPGNYTLEFSCIGFSAEKVEQLLEEGDVVTLDMLLPENAELLDVVVVSGSKFEKRVSEETVSLEVIPPSLVENANNVRVDEAVEKVPGVSVIDGQANIRGGSGYSYGAGSRVMLLMDDLPILTGDAGFPNWDFLPIENLEQVEVIKGAASALYGSAALNGIINLRTAYPKSEPESKVAAFTQVWQNPRNNEVPRVDENGEPVLDEEGNQIIDKKSWWGEQFPIATGFSAAHRQKFGQLDFVGGINAYGDDSWRRSQFTRRIRGNANLRYRATPNISVGLNTNIQVNTSSSFLIWNGDGVDAYTLWDATPRIINKSFKLTLDPFVEYFTESGFRVKYLGRYYKADNKNNTNQSTLSDLYYSEIQAQKRWEDISLVLTGGVVGQLSTVEAELYGNQTLSASNIGVYLQADKKFFDKLNVSAGFRFERNEIEGDKEAKPVGRLGLNYELAEYTFLRASVGQGYRFPTIAERYVETQLGNVDVGINVPVGIFPNPDLQSETGWSAELGIKQGIGLGEWKGFIDISGFINEYNDMMEFTFGVDEALLQLDIVQDIYPGLDTTVIDLGGQAAGFQSLNIGDTRIVGGEISVAGKGKLFGFPTTMLAGYTYIVPKFQEFDRVQEMLSSVDYNVLKYRFRHTAKIDIQTDIKRVGIGLSLQHTSRMEAIDQAFNVFLPGIQEFRDRNDGGTSLVDLRFLYSPNDNDKFSFLVRNLFNVEYALRPALIDAPRSFTLKYARNF